MRTNMLVPLISALALVIGGLVLVQAAQDVNPAGKGEKSAVKGSATKTDEDSKEYVSKYPPRHSLKAILKKLGITDEQKKQFKSLYVGYRDTTRKARTELISFKDEKKTMLLSGKIDQQKLAQIDDRLVKAKAEFLKEKLKFKRDLLAVLSPEQLEKISDWMAERIFLSKLKKMHGGGMMGGGGMMDRGGMKCKGLMMQGGGMMKGMMHGMMGGDDGEMRGDEE